MRLSYGELIGYSPIRLSIGSIRKPLLKDIDNLGFELFNQYESLLFLTAEIYYTKFLGEKGLQYWNGLPDTEKQSLNLLDVIENDEQMRDEYLAILNFFFVEDIIYSNGMFVILNIPSTEINEQIDETAIRGGITKKNLDDVLKIIQQICGIYEEKENEKDIKFKNNTAKKIYEKLQKANKKKKEKQKSDINLSIPNIISSLCGGKHPSINYTNVFEMTIYQLLDTFNKLQLTSIYDIDSTRVSVWGDEKKTFKPSLWYTNQYDTRK